MKKFTNISGAVVGKPKEIKIDEKREKIQDFSNQIMHLMDSFLSVRSYGNARPELIMPVKIVGKELFIEALQDLLKKEENKKIVQILESLKKDIHDWPLIDNKIEELSNSERDIRKENKILQMIEKWGSDEESLKVHVMNLKEKLDNDSLQDKIVMVREMLQSCKDKDVYDKLVLIDNTLSS